jgi:ribosomal protein L7/L12
VGEQVVAEAAPLEDDPPAVVAPEPVDFVPDDDDEQAATVTLRSATDTKIVVLRAYRFITASWWGHGYGQIGA